MATIKPTMRLRRLLPAAFLAAAATVGGSALADPPVACAAPNSGGGYDDARYEECRKSGLHERFCCSQAGGTWTKVTVYGKDGKSVSTYYMCTGSAPRPATAGATPGIVGAGPLEPAAPPPITGVPSRVVPAYSDESVLTNGSS